MAHTTPRRAIFYSPWLQPSLPTQEVLRVPPQKHCRLSLIFPRKGRALSVKGTAPERGAEQYHCCAVTATALLPFFLSLCLECYMHRGQTALPTAPRFTLGQYFSEKQLFPLLVNAYLFCYLQVESTPKITVGKARKQHWGERIRHLLHVKVAFQSHIIGGR